MFKYLSIFLMLSIISCCGVVEEIIEETIANPIEIPVTYPKPECPKCPPCQDCENPEPEPVPPVPTPDPEKNFCVQDGLDFTKPGPYSVKKKDRNGHKLYLPTGLPDNCKAPIASIGNGTGARCIFYQSIAMHLASHGYLVSCAETTQSGDAKMCMEGMEYLRGLEHADGDMFFSTGHSQGGSSANHCGFKYGNKYPSAKVAVVGIEPAFGMGWPNYYRDLPNMRADSFQISGTDDTVVGASYVYRGYKYIQGEKYWYEARGISHFNPQTVAKEAGLLFGNWKLMGYQSSRNLFLDLPKSFSWKDMSGYGGGRRPFEVKTIDEIIAEVNRKLEGKRIEMQMKR
jgi:hypothetical protein